MENISTPESLAAANLREALTQIEQTLIDRGYKRVHAREIARAKAPIEMVVRPEHLEIVIDDDDIVAISLIGLNFEKWDSSTSSPLETNVVGWANAEDHLSGAASVDQFKGRILAATGPSEEV